ncbi:MAG: hypothetical protein FWB85_09520 [Chitinispirillia bacterium]|nr:hypothetical protein [Chitinispirillia bacterium]MCL2242425.1 hypothetical protein [Chitinispirillia bacterium]
MRKNDDIFIGGASRARPFVQVYEQREAEVVHGPSYRAGDEVFVDRCVDDCVEIVERRGGGGTVVLSPGVLVIIVVGDKKSEREGALDVFGRVHDVIVSALCKAGVYNVVRAGISDLAVDGKKILGSSLYMGTKPPLFYYQSSLMVSNDLTLIDRYLRHPPKEPDYRQGRGHRQFCTTLKELGVDVDIKELSVQIESHLRDNLR